MILLPRTESRIFPPTLAVLPFLLLISPADLLPYATLPQTGEPVGVGDLLWVAVVGVVIVGVGLAVRFHRKRR